MMLLPYVHDKPRFWQPRHAMGVHALLCTRAEDFGQKMKEFLEYDSSLPLLLECVVKNEHVLPMVSVVWVASSQTFS
jgi:acetolactate synthase-1/2/3 large subunit